MKLPSTREQFYTVVNEAIADFTEHGFDSQARLDKWLDAINVAARRALVPESVLSRTLRDSLLLSYRRAITENRLTRVHPQLSRFTIDSIKPKLRGELDRRILASANLIRLNREASIQKTLQRVSGWATSIPVGGTRVRDKDDVKRIRRGIASLPFEERRVIIDQGHKLVAAVDDIIATDGGAIAAEWMHVHEGGGYQARPEHVARDGDIFLIRDSWAIQDGLVKKAGHQYTDEVDQPAEKPFCRCRWKFIYAIGDLPREMLTKHGAEILKAVRITITRGNRRILAAVHG